MTATIFFFTVCLHISKMIAILKTAERKNSVYRLKILEEVTNDNKEPEKEKQGQLIAVLKETNKLY